MKEEVKLLIRAARKSGSISEKTYNAICKKYGIE